MLHDILFVEESHTQQTLKLQRTADVPNIDRDEHRTVVRFLANIHQVR